MSATRTRLKHDFPIMPDSALYCLETRLLLSWSLGSPGSWSGSLIWFVHIRLGCWWNPLWVAASVGGAGEGSKPLASSFSIGAPSTSIFIILGSKITADGECSHEIKRCLLLGRKVMTNLDSILKSRGITLPTKVPLSSVQFSSVTQSCPTLCDPMDRSMPGLPVYHQLLEFTQTHVHWVSDAIQLSHPLSSPSSPALSLSQHQGLFKWISSSHQVAKILEFQLQHQSFQWTLRNDLL